MRMNEMKNISSVGSHITIQILRKFRGNFKKKKKKSEASSSKNVIFFLLWHSLNGTIIIIFSLSNRKYLYWPIGIFQIDRERVKR